MSHSKRNTSLAFFTNYERDQLKDRWGSQKARLTRESFLPLGACHLCLQSAREPVACRDGGHIFCRECAVTNLLAQKQEIKRLEREDERRRDEEAQVEQERADEAQEEAVRGFEKTMAGTESEANQSKRKLADSSNDSTERAATRRKLDGEKNSKASQPFWMPASIEAANTATNTSTRKSHPTCPSASSKDTHPLSLKSLITVNFTTVSSTNTKSGAATNAIEPKDGAVAATCPSCKKSLSSNAKAVLTVPCGHVICKVCVDQFMKPKQPSSASKHVIPIKEEQPLLCYVCQTDLAGGEDQKKDGKKSKEKSKVKPGLVELCNEGTGFASAGKAVVDKGGIAFQC